MKYRYLPIYAVFPALCLLGMAGCRSARTAPQITVGPVATLVPDSTSSVTVDVTVEVPAHAFSKRSRLVVVPQLLSADTVVAECAPLVLDAPVYRKKMERRQELHDYKDSLLASAQAVSHRKSYSFPYQERVTVPADISGGRITAVISADGCGECSLVDSVDMAYIGNLPTLIAPKEELHLNWMEPKYVIRPKVIKGQGEALLQFVINRHDINLNMGNNREEMNRMLETLQRVATDSLATLQTVSIYGMASADGSYAFNTTLSRNRAQAARRWLEQQLQIDLEQQVAFSIGSRPEGWMPVLQAMRADRHPDTLLVQQILEKYPGENDDPAEYRIRRLACWPDIRARYLQKDRKVEYEYTYTVRNFTSDAELLDMYGKRPDAFNEEELLRVSTLKTSPEEKMEVYRTLLHYFPQSQVAANNLAVLLLRQNKPDEAEAVLRSLDEYSPEMLNTRAAIYVYRNQYEKAIELLDTHVDLPEARYNLGLLKAARRQLDEAYRLLHTYNDVNAAVVALSMGRNDEARRMLEQCNDTTPRAHYVRALTDARQQHTDSLMDHLARAVEEERFRLRARTEPDFMPYQSDPRFMRLTAEKKEEDR